MMTELVISASASKFVGNTTIFIRNDKVALETVEKFRGFPLDFKNQYFEQAADLEDSLSHHRIVTYRLGDLRIMLRHAADGYIHDDTPGPEEALASYNAVGGEEHHYDNITVKAGGALIPRSAMLKLNTCKKYGNQGNRLKAKFRESWLSQQGHYITAKYNIVGSKKGKRSKDFKGLRGEFKAGDIVHDRVDVDTVRWAVEHQDIVHSFYKKVNGVVRLIRSAVAHGAGGTYVVARMNGSANISIS